MDWSFTEEQEQIAALTRQILERELTEERMRSAWPFDEKLYRTLSDAGVLDPSLGLIELCRVLVEIGRAVAPVPAVPAVIARKAGAVGSIPTLALVEDLNPDLEAPTTRAARDGDSFVLTGTKTTVPVGGIADVLVVSAVLEDGTPALFAVPRDAQGVELREQVVTNNDREAILDLNDVKVPADHHLGGADAVKRVIDRFTVALCAVQLGVCERALELTAEYAKTRVQFDRPIATFQAVGQRLADAFIDVEGIRLTVWQAAWRLEEGLPADTEIATAKFWAADGGHRVAHTAVHVHGGVGIDLDYPLHRYFVAAKRLEFMLGNASEQLRNIGKTLATEPA
jgi:alkylation response protein AidB-like acyl-CoA dehydrogenase